MYDQPHMRSLRNDSLDDGQGILRLTRRQAMVLGAVAAIGAVGGASDAGPIGAAGGNIV